MNKLKELRSKSQKTQEDVAKSIGISVSSYNTYENGSRKISLKNAKKIAEFFGVEIEDIFLAETFTISKS